MARLAMIPIVAALIVAIIPSWARAEGPSDAAMAKAHKVIEASNAMSMAGGAMLASLPQQIAIQKQAHPDIPDEFWTEYQKAFREEFEKRKSELETHYATMYAKTFTEDELTGLLAFYQSDLGQKTIQQMPKLMQDGMQFGQQWGAEVGRAAGQRAAAIVKSHAGKAAQ